MYLEHFGLSELPFSITPDTSFYFNHASHREALNVLLVALRSGEGFIKVTGEVGFGKTLLCRKLLNSLGPEFVTAYIPNPHLSPGSMRQSLAEEIGAVLNKSRYTQEELLRVITGRLLEIARDGKHVVLCLDEAQELPMQTLEAVRLLTNLETEKSKLLRVVMFGQPELDDKLARREIRQLKQRITFSYSLAPLDKEATSEYINHRLRIAGYRGAPLFERRAVDLVYRAGRGTPRLINVLCHKALMAAFGPGERQVSRAHVRAAIADTEDTRGALDWWWRPIVIGGLISLGAAGIYLGIQFLLGGGV